MAPLYKPPTRVATSEKPLLALVTALDPDFERVKHREVEYYSSSGKVFSIADPDQRGLYNLRSNVYPVGQPYGGLDQEVVDNRPLYSGIPTDEWA